MSLTFSEYLNIPTSTLQDLGAFDPILSVDSKFFIDPKSLETTAVSEFKNARDKLFNRYADIFELLNASKEVGDRFWKAAYEHFPKGEVEELCIGYGFDNTGGRGMGHDLVNETLITVKDFISSGIDNPLLLELVGFFQKGVGSDIVSDMIGRALLDEIIAFTTRVTNTIASLTDIEPESYEHNKVTQSAFKNPSNNKRVLLIPADILQPLPVAEDWDSVDRVSAANAQVRNDFARMVGAYDWKRAKSRMSKDALKDAMLKHPSAVDDLIEKYDKKPAKPAYDFKEDPSGEYKWLDDARRFVKDNPLALPSASSPAEVNEVVKKIISKFKSLVENNGAWASFYTRGKGSKLMHESYPQKFFYGVADAYCDASNLDISPETNSGRGPVDFKFSNGRKAKVLVEMKYTASSHLRHGFEKQIGEYEKAEKPYSTHYLVLKVSAPTDYSDDLNSAIADAIEAKKVLPVIDYIDARKKESASKV